jgi:hypothetical protein
MAIALVITNAACLPGNEIVVERASQLGSQIDIVLYIAALVYPFAFLFGQHRQEATS